MPCLLVFPEREDDNRALDSILSLCNFLRHSNKHLSFILKARVSAKILNILDELPKNPHIINSGVRFISKILEYNCS